MDNEFTIARVNSRLEYFKSQLEDLAEDNDNTEQEIIGRLKEIINEIESEKALAIKNDNSVIQKSNYIPALDEALLFIFKYLDDPSTIELSECVYDASLSLGYFRWH